MPTARERRFVPGKPLLVVAAASIALGCSTSEPVRVDASSVSGNLDMGCYTCDANVRPVDAHADLDAGIDAGSEDAGDANAGDASAGDASAGDGGRDGGT